MGQYSLLHALIGGILIGLASLMAALLSEKVPGISGVFGRLLVPRTPDPPSRELRRGEQGGSGDKLWRVVFLVGLIGAAALCFTLWESAALFRPVRPLTVMAIAGLLVGFGTRLGKGCTSGHGVCGVATGAKDSIVATLIFVGAAMVTVFIYNRVNL